MGLLDGNLDDPQKQMLMALAAGLLQGSGRTNKNFGADLGNAIPQGLMALNQGRALKSRELDAEQQRQMHATQLAQMQRQADQQGKIDALAPQFFSSGQPLTPNDDMGNPMPKAPPSFDLHTAGRVASFQVKRSVLARNRSTNAAMRRVA
jgi:hypothetical protein